MLLLLFVLPLFAANRVEFLKQLGAPNEAKITGVASDREGSVFVAGTTTAFDFPTKNAFQGANRGTAQLMSEDGGRTWMPLGPIAGAAARPPAPHPKDADILLANSEEAIYRSADRGRSWVRVQQGTRLGEIAWNRADPDVVYAASSGGVLKSMDGGLTWKLLDASQRDPGCCLPAGIAIDPFHPQVVYWTAGNHALQSRDGGASWTVLPLSARMLTPSPAEPDIVFATDGPALQRSMDGGRSWRPLVAPSTFFYTIAPTTTPGLVYLGAYGALLATRDNGDTWRTAASGNHPGLAVDPFTAQHLLRSGAGGVEAGISEDGGTTWLPPPVGRQWQSFRFDPDRRGRILAVAAPTQDVFLAKFRGDGEMVFSTYLGGSGVETMSSLVVGEDGAAYVTGTTSSNDFGFPCSARACPFAAKVSGEGTLLYLTPVGSLELADAAVDSSGQLHVAGNGVDGAQVLVVSRDGTMVEERLRVEPAVTKIAIQHDGSILLAGFFGRGEQRLNLLKFSPSGAVVFEKFLPGTGLVTVDRRDNIYVAGAATVADFPSINAGCPHDSGFFGRFSQRAPWMTDIFVAKLDPDGETTVLSKLLGGSCRDGPVSLAVGEDGSIALTGETWSDPFPVVNPIAGPPEPRNPKSFAAMLTADGSLAFSSYLPGEGLLWPVAVSGDSLFAGNGGTLWKISTANSKVAITRITDTFARRNGAITPSEIVTLETPGFDPEAAVRPEVSPARPLPFELNGIKVRFGEWTAPLLGLQRGEITCVTPAEIRSGTVIPVTIFLGDEPVAEHYAEVVDRRPALLPVILNADGLANSAATPAKRGSKVRFHFSGTGLTSDAATPVRLTSYSLQLLFANADGRGIELVNVTELSPAQGYVPGVWESTVQLSYAVAGQMRVSIPGSPAITIFLEP